MQESCVACSSAMPYFSLPRDTSGETVGVGRIERKLPNLGTD